jgi:hypothetical protein
VFNSLDNLLENKDQILSPIVESKLNEN